MLTPGGVRELNLLPGTEQQAEPEPEPEPETQDTPEWLKKLNRNSDPTQTAEATPEPEPEPELTPAQTAETEQLTLLTPWRDQKLLVVRAARIPIVLARNELNATDRATYPEGWKNVLLLGSPVLLLGFLVMFIIERIKRRSYMLPDEGRRSARREKKEKAKLDNLTTETVRVKEHEDKDSENAEHDDRNGAAADEPSGHGGGKPV
jgi:heme exporter protein D